MVPYAASQGLENPPSPPVPTPFTPPTMVWSPPNRSTGANAVPPANTHQIQVTTENVNSEISGDRYIHDNVRAQTFQSDVYSASADTRAALVNSLIFGIPKIVIHSGAIFFLLRFIMGSSVINYIDIEVPDALPGILATLVAAWMTISNIVFVWLKAKNTSVQMTSRTIIISSGIFSIGEQEISFHNIKSINGTKSIVEKFLDCGDIVVEQGNGLTVTARFLPSHAIKLIRDQALAYTAKVEGSAR